MNFLKYSITIGVLGIVFLVPTAPVSAVTVAELQVQLQALIAQLTALIEARKTAGQPTPSVNVSSCPKLYRSLTLDSVGDDVKALQQFLNRSGFLVAPSGFGSPGNETRTFWYGTRDALKRYQATYGLVTTGILDDVTRSKITTTCSAYSVGPAPQKPIVGSGGGGAGSLGGGSRKEQIPTRSTSGGGGGNQTGTSTTTGTGTRPGATTTTTSVPATPAPETPGKIYLKNLLTRASTFVVNGAWKELPTRFSDIPLDANGNPDYSSGSLVVTPSGFSYGNSAGAGSRAFTILAPSFDGDVTKANFGGIEGLSMGANWTLRFTAGLRSDAPPETKAVLRVGVVADKLKPSDAPWEFLSTTEVSAGRTYTISVPLGMWPLRDGFVLVLETEKVGPNNYWQGIVIDDARLEAERPMPWNSVGRGGIYPESPVKQNQILSALAQIPADWHRIEAPQTVADAKANATILKQIQDQGKKMLLILGPSSEDYGWDLSKARYTNDPLFQQKCNTSWGSFRLSLTDFATYEENLTKKLQTLRDAGVKIEAFDIGNELDWVCFNGDLPLDRIANQQEIDTTTRAYAKLLEHSVRAIDASYPNAITVSGLSANLIHGTDIYATGMIRTPGRVIKALSSLDGKNYLSLIDRIGMHFYPDPDDPSTITGDLATYHSDAGSPNKPYWVTEWGYAQNRFPTARGRDRYAAFAEFYGATTKSSVPVVENIFFYALDDFNWGGHTLVDSNYNLLPEASKFFSKF